jgi:hypothetical protein
MTRKLIGAALALLMTSGAAFADDVRTLGAGANATCGRWSADRQSGNAFSVSNWALGFLSGAAAFSENLNPLEGLDSDAVLYWIDNYCRSRPLDKFTVALRAFIDEHPK